MNELRAREETCRFARDLCCLGPSMDRCGQCLAEQEAAASSISLG